MTFLPVPAGSLREKSHVTEEEAKSIWLEAEKSHVRMLIQTLWYTGLRISEALKIRSCDVQRNGYEYSILVTRGKQQKRTKKKRELAVVKSELLPVARVFGLDLYDYIKSNSIKGEQRLFPAHRSTYWRQIRECARRANIPTWRDVHPHSFRHGFVYDKAKRGVHPYTLSRIAGHTQLGTTMEYYQPTQEDLRNAMEK